MLRKFAAVFAVVLGLTSTNTTRAEPGPVVNWLMNEPISLFDLGMHRLSNAVRYWQKKVTEEKPDYWVQEFGGLPNYSVAYDWDLNRIFIRAQVGTIHDNAKEACRNLVTDALMQAYIGPDILGDFEMFAPGSEGGYSRFASFFSHYAYRTGSEPEEYRSRLDNIIILEATVTDLRSGADPVKCFRPLIGYDKIYFEE
jgi:hypothetical protein